MEKREADTTSKIQNNEMVEKWNDASKSVYKQMKWKEKKRNENEKYKYIWAA